MIIVGASARLDAGLGDSVRIAYLLASTLLVGCNSGWYKEGARAGDFERDRHACNMDAAQMYPVHMTTTTFGTGYQAPSRTTCQTYGTQTNCTTQPGNYTAPQQQTSDANLNNRTMAFGSCMRARGYTFKFG